MEDGAAAKRVEREEEGMGEEDRKVNTEEEEDAEAE